MLELGVCVRVKSDGETKAKRSTRYPVPATLLLLLLLQVLDKLTQQRQETKAPEGSERAAERQVQVQTAGGHSLSSWLLPPPPTRPCDHAPMLPCVRVCVRARQNVTLTASLCRWRFLRRCPASAGVDRAANDLRAVLALALFIPCRF